MPKIFLVQILFVYLHIGIEQASSLKILIIFNTKNFSGSNKMSIFTV